jgi:hypothetical protein
MSQKVDLGSRILAGIGVAALTFLGYILFIVGVRSCDGAPTPQYRVITATPSPENRFAPTPTPGPPACISWRDASKYIGTYQCICGTVSHTEVQGSIFFIHFSRDKDSFYGMSYNYAWEGIDGNCVMICGDVVENYGRPRIIIEKREGQVFNCEGVPTRKPQPTATQMKPTATSVPTKQVCVSWQDADKYIGTYRCVCGAVTHAYVDPQSNAFFLDFTDDHTAYYAVSFTCSWTDLVGRCVMICGLIQSYEGRPETVIENCDLPGCP